MAYLPIIDLLKHNFQVEEGDDDATISAKIERGMEALGEELQSAIPHIKYLLAVPPGDEAVLSLDAQQRRLELFEALRAMMLQGGQRRGRSSWWSRICTGSTRRLRGGPAAPG